MRVTLFDSLISNRTGSSCTQLLSRMTLISGKVFAMISDI